MTTTPVWISLGSNLGDRQETLRAALGLLDQTPGVAVRSLSSFQETRPVGGPPEQGTFLNAAARLETTLRPEELLSVTRAIEDRLGRVRTVRWGERTLDIDLLIFGDEFVDTPSLKIPHPRLAFRRFVLDPLVEIAPDRVDVVTGRTVADLRANLDRTPRWIGFVGEVDPVFWAVLEALFVELSRSTQSSDNPDRWNLAFDPWTSGRCPWVEPALHFTFLVVLPSSTLIRGPSVGAVPALWVESDNPAAIVAEVMATCSGMII